MDLGTVIHSYGGPALFVWAWLQGEAAVIVGGSLAQQGYWPWWAVWLIACVPATAGHQIYFALGRRYGERVLARLPSHWQPAITRARALVRENDGRIMLLMRFAYGIRLPLPILCGAAGVVPHRFLRYNAGTALAWALLFTCWDTRSASRPRRRSGGGRTTKPGSWSAPWRWDSPCTS